MLKILLVDDYAPGLDSPKRLIEFEGFADCEIRLADDGDTALAVMTNFTPDLIVTDLSMPRMDGFTLIKTVRAAGCGAVIVLMSADVHSDIADLAKEAGANHFISKIENNPQQKLFNIIQDLVSRDG